MAGSILALLAIACGLGGPTERDRQRLAELERLFGDRCVFAFDNSIYLKARATREPPLTEEDAHGILRTFWLDGDSRRSDTRYVYLNVYELDGRFAFQLYWDSQREAIVRSAAEYY